jgi:trk system potassium uptake protein TrkA
MEELDASSPPKHSLICMIFRGHRVIIPRGSDRLMAGDHIYIVVGTNNFEECMDFMGLPPAARLQRVFILGGSQIGIELAKHLEKSGVQVKIFEKNRNRCEKISSLVKRSLVIHADGTDQRILSEENIEDIDVYMALTRDDEDNIIASLLSKRLGAKKAIALVNRLDLLPIVPLLGVNASLSLRLVAVDRILQFVRKGQVLSVHTFRQEEAEAIEVLATSESPYVGKQIKDLHLPHSAIIGAIARKDGSIVVPRGESVINPGDRVIFFCLENVVQELESAFITEA